MTNTDEITEIDNKQNKKEESRYKYFWTLVIFSVLLVGSLWYWNYCYLVSYDSTIRGTFGDMFGAVNSVFSGLAFAGIIISLYLQRIDLRIQQDEIKQTNKEFHIQNETLQIQKFENTFFNMLSLHHQIVNNMDFDIKTLNFSLRNKFPKIDIKFNPEMNEKIMLKESVSKSRDFFKDSLFFLDSYISSEFIFTSPYNKFKYITCSNQFNIITDFDKIYKTCYDKLNTDLGHYFRNLYRMIKIIDEKEFSKNKIENFKTQYSYTSIIRAQLSDAEIGWLFYNCIYMNGKEKFKPLIEKYSIFSNINEDTITSSYYNLYNLSAFEKPVDIKTHIAHFEKYFSTITNNKHQIL